MSVIRQLVVLVPGLAPGITRGGLGSGTISELPISPLATGALWETAAGLLVIIGMIFGLSWLMRRFGKRPLMGKGVVSVLGGVSLGPRERAVLLQVGTTRLLVGVAPGRVQTLHVLGQQENHSEPKSEDGFQGRLETEMERDI